MAIEAQGLIGHERDLSESTACDVVVNAKGEVMVVVVTDLDLKPGTLVVLPDVGDLWLRASAGMNRLGELPNDLMSKVMKVLECLLTIVWEGEIRTARRVPVLQG